MPGLNIRLGSPQIFLSVSTNTALVDITGSPPDLDATALTPTDVLINDIVQPLDSTDTYAVTLALVGEDKVNQGYTIGKALAPVTGITVTTGQGIYVHIANADWPVGFDGAICAAVFLKINSANYQLQGFAYIDPQEDFNYMISNKPLRVLPRYAIGDLTAATVDLVLGSRAPYAVTWAEITPTSGEFNFRRPVTNVPISFNSGPDFQVATSRGVGITFQCGLNDIKSFVQAGAGVYRKFVGDSSSVVTNANVTMSTAQAILRGNRACTVYMPVGADGNQEIRLLVGLLTFNQSELAEVWGKSTQTNVQFTFENAALDRLINDQFTEVQYSRQG